MGLGEKLLKLPLDGTIEDVEFPSMQNGYDLMKCIGPRRSLVCLEGEYDVRSLSAEIKQSRTYVRPIQVAERVVSAIQ